MISAIYFPVIKFLTETGETVCEEVKLNDFGPKVVGDSVTVLYDPKRPRDFCNSRDLVYYRLELVGCVVGIVLCITGLIP